MSPRKFNPNQTALLIIEPETNEITLNPVVTGDEPAPPDYDRTRMDPNPGLSTPLIEGWIVLSKVIKEIARARSNVGFDMLPERSRPVRKFAEQIDKFEDETQTVVRHSIPKKYEHAGQRLMDYRNKQVNRALKYNKIYQIVPDQVIRDMLPMDASTVEHRFFYANSPAEAKEKAKKRQAISRFVSKHGL